MSLAPGTVFYGEQQKAQDRDNVAAFNFGATHVGTWPEVRSTLGELCSFDLPEENTVGLFSNDSLELNDANSGGLVQIWHDPLLAVHNSCFGNCAYETFVYREQPVERLGWLGVDVGHEYRFDPRAIAVLANSYVVNAESETRPDPALRYRTRLRRGDSGTAESRRATQELALGIQSLLPDMSEEALGALVGVSRIGWRGWSQAETASRRRKRERLIRLKSILELRRRVAPGESLTNWLETPVGMDLSVTPARLFTEGRDQVVAMLAARARAPESDGLALEAPLDLGGLTNNQRVAEELRLRRELTEDIPEM
jgi:hypothetical protein